MSHVSLRAIGVSRAHPVRDAVRLAVMASACAFAVSPAFSQESRPADTEEIQSVIVTGSRLSQSGFTTPTPVTVLGADVIQELGITNIGQGANTLPAFRATTTPTTNGWGSFNVGAQIVNLRGLGVSRNLVLVDGRRFAPVTREGTVDLNLVPSGLVERLDVVTGGASAAYGSDAVAGAVNVILDKKLTGLKAQLDFGSSTDGDGDNWHASLAGGAPFAAGRGHYVLGGEYAQQDGIGDCFTRSYCTPGVVVNNAGANNGLPNFYRLGTDGGFIANTRGVISSLSTVPANATSTAIRNLLGTGAVTFTDAGVPIPYTLGLPASGVTASGGDITPSFTTAQLETPVERYTGFGHAYFDFTDDVQGFIEGSYGHVDGTVLQSRYFGAGVTIYNDNPFVPDAIRALMPPVSATPSGTRPAAGAFGLSVLGQRRGESSSKADSWRATTGLKGKFNDTWSWDAYYQYAHTDRKQVVENNLVTGASRVINRPGSGGVSNAASFAYWSWATDAVYDPADAALPVAQRRITCRALISPDPALRAAAAGCAAFNPFGTANTTQAALDYVYQTLTEEIDIAQHVVAANVQGSFGDLWAGPLSTAAGVEFRRDSTDIVHDSLSNVFAYFQNFGADYDASQRVIEGYVEAELPLLKDAPFARTLSLNAAARRTHYDIEGFGSFNQAAAENSIDATTWKAGLVWEPLDWMRVRATQSRDIRAPNFNDLFQASASTFGSVVNRFAANASQFPVQLSGGNPLIDAEKGHTTTVGLVIQPPFAEGLSLSLDYYHIKVNDYIASPGGAQNIVDRCFFVSEPVACSLITFGANQSLAEIRNVNVNLDWLRTSGLDVEAAYRLPLSTFSSLPGSFNFRLLATRTYEISTNVLGVVIDRAGETGGLSGAPTWLANLYTGYTGGPFSLTLSTRYIAKGRYNAQYIDPNDAGYSPTAPNTINDNHVGGAVYFNLNGSVNIGMDGKLQVFGQVNNLTNRAPPSAPQLQYPSNPVFFDLIGTTYRVGVRTRF